MYRIERRNWTEEEIGYVSNGGMFDLFDNSIKEIYRINDDEYDYICEHASDEELDLMVKQDHTFTEKKELINIIDKYVKVHRQLVCN